MAMHMTFPTPTTNEYSARQFIQHIPLIHKKEVLPFRKPKIRSDLHQNAFSAVQGNNMPQYVDE
jgi:hypothetical protein